MLLPEPSYSGPENVVYFRGTSLEDEINRDKRIMWLVTFYTVWSPSCVNFAPIFSKLSAEWVDCPPNISHSLDQTLKHWNVKPNKILAGIRWIIWNSAKLMSDAFRRCRKSITSTIRRSAVNCQPSSCLKTESKRCAVRVLTAKANWLNSFSLRYFIIQSLSLLIYWLFLLHSFGILASFFYISG